MMPPNGDAEVVVQQVNDPERATSENGTASITMAVLTSERVLNNDEQDDEQRQRQHQSSGVAGRRSMYSYWPLQKML